MKNIIAIITAATIAFGVTSAQSQGFPNMPMSPELAQCVKGVEDKMDIVNMAFDSAKRLHQKTNIMLYNMLPLTNEYAECFIEYGNAAEREVMLPIIDETRSELLTVAQRDLCAPDLRMD